MFDGKFVMVGGVPEGDSGTYTVHGDQLATIQGHRTGHVTYQWSLDGDELTLTPVEECAFVRGEKTDCTQDPAQMDPMMRTVTEHTFTRSGDEGTY